MPSPLRSGHGMRAPLMQCICAGGGVSHLHGCDVGLRLCCLAL